MIIEEKISLKPYNTFGLEVQADYLQRFSSIDELKQILKSALYKENEHFILGGGSNVLFTKKQFKALVLKNEILGKKIINESNEFVDVQFGAGEVWHECVLWAIENDFGGIENLSLIPGTMGAAPMQNIGAYGVEIKSVIQEVQAIEKNTGLSQIFSAGECAFGYRESVFKHSLKNKYVITHVVLRLTKKHIINTTYGAIIDELIAQGVDVEKATIKNVSEAVINIRQRKLPNPKEIGNAGSFFKNPVLSKSDFKQLQEKYPNIKYYKQSNGIKVPAGWLIDQAGWKGFLEGEIGIHKNQALVLVNYGNGVGADLYALSQKIINDVKTRYGIDLEREVNIC